MENDQELLFIERVLRLAGRHVLSSFGDKKPAKKKQDLSQIVTAVDISSEKLIVTEIQEAYPQSSIIAEESGFLKKNIKDAWIIDPIDGTSNFANGLPWFGVMIAHIVKDTPVTSGIYLPVTDEMYLGKIDIGAFKNGKRLEAVSPQDLSLSLIAFGTDGSDRSMPLTKKADIITKILPNVLNIRSTNSVVDYCYTLDGRLAAAISLEGRIWDVAPIVPLVKEVHGKASDIFGSSLAFTVDEENIRKNYTLLLASSEETYRKLLSLTRIAS